LGAIPFEPQDISSKEANQLPQKEAFPTPLNQSDYETSVIDSDGQALGQSTENRMKV